MPSFYQEQKEIFEAFKNQLDKSLELDSSIEANSYEELVESIEKELSKIKNNIIKNK
jgi:hypothetical protein